MKKRISKISQRLTITFGSLFFIALLLVNIATLFSVKYYINQTAEQQLVLLVETIQSEIKNIDDINTIDIRQYSQIAENVDINLVVNKTSIFNSGETDSFNFIDVTILDQVISTEKNEGRILYLNSDYKLTDGTNLTIQLVKDMDNSDQYIDVISGVILGLDLAVFAIAILAGYYLSRKALKPINQMTEQAQKISATDLSSRIQSDGPDDELKRLANTFNDLIKRIEEVYKKQNRFTIDASHELATPIAVIKGYVDLLDRWGKKKPEVLDESIQAIKVEIDNISQLLDTLLFLSKGDNSVYQLNTKTFFISDLINEITKESKLISDNHLIESDNREIIEIEADYNLIKQMLRAIINNSIKYSKENTKIKINYYVNQDNLYLEIADQGVGIAKKEIPYIFDRFYRIDKARSRENGGTGLGLSLVKWIVDIHHGSINVESVVDQGTTMIVCLPLKIN